MQLFSLEDEPDFINIPLKDGDVDFYLSFIPFEECTEIYKLLFHETKWKEDDITVFGKTYKQPRLTALYGEEAIPYSYSNITMYPLQFTPTLLMLKKRVEEVSNTAFNTVLLNLYRDGSDSNGWHSDDEKELGKHPFIASLSFGETRMFHLRHKQDRSSIHKLPLGDGSLLLMRGATQENYKHQVPKTKKLVKPRINLTFRNLKKTLVK